MAGAGGSKAKSKQLADLMADEILYCYNARKSTKALTPPIKWPSR
jgi:hypothetical protein